MLLPEPGKTVFLTFLFHYLLMDLKEIAPGMDMRGVALFLVVLIAGLWATNGAVTGLVTVPGPLFGGDVYFQLGEIYRMYQEPVSEWFGTSNGIGTLPHYLPVYGILVVLLGKIMGLAAPLAIIDFNYPLLLLSLAALFLLFRKLFGGNEIAVGLALAFAYLGFPLFKYTDFTRVLMAPLFAYALYCFYSKQDMRNSIVLGIVYGLLSLSHSTGFIFGSLSIAAFYLVLFREELGRMRNPAQLLDFLKARKEIVVAPVLGFLIAQIYWFAPIFVFLGKTPLQTNIWSQPDYRNLSYSLMFAVDIISKQLFNISSLLTAVKSALALFGLYVLFVKKEGAHFVRDFFIVTAIITFSYLVTSPLFDFHFLPGYMEDIYLNLAMAMVAVVGAKALMEKSGTYSTAVIIVVLLALVQHASSGLETLQADKYYKSANDGLPPVYESLQAYLLANTSYKDTLLSTNELSFMANGLSGRNVMVNRRAHTSVFATDFDQRQVDAMLILYGNNASGRLALLKKYNVSYIYYDTGWYSMEFQFDQQGQVTGFFDPLMAVWAAQYEKTLNGGGVDYYNTSYWLDPSLSGPDVRKYHTLILKADNYDFTGYGPWKDDLDAHLQEVWSWGQGGRKAAALYKVKYD
ncbi:Uncharacterised protein [uncultured archaeon]|nr:Uncharacterised protein [uncultured archaeon]